MWAHETIHFILEKGFIYRVWRPKGAMLGDVRSSQQLVLPKKYQQVVLQLAHDIPMSGHLGITKTKDRIVQRYYWPRVFQDVAAYCRPCPVCQRSGTRKLLRAPLRPIPLVERTFQRIAMNLIGSLPETA